MDGSEFEADFIPAAMLAQRIVGIMAHWREYMREYPMALTDLGKF